MRQVKYYCDHCGNEVRNADALRNVEVQRFSWARDAIFHVCSDCQKAIEDFLGSARHTKPPLGLVPRFIRDEARVKEILEAIGNYNNAGLPVPKEWLDELNEKTKTQGGTR